MARLLQITKQLNIGISTAVDLLNKKGQPIEENPNTKLTDLQEQLLIKEFSSDKSLKEQSEKLIQQRQDKDKPLLIAVEGYEAKENAKKAAAKKSAEKSVEQQLVVPFDEEEKPIEKVEIPQKNEEVKVVVEPKVDVEVVDKVIKKNEIVDKKSEEDIEENIEKQIKKQIEKIAKREEKKLEKQEGKIKENEKNIEKKIDKQEIKTDKSVKKQEKDIKKEQKQQEKQEKTEKIENTEVKQEEKNKEPEIFKYESRFAPKIGFKIVGEKIDLTKVAEPQPLHLLSRSEKKAKYKERERQKREAEKIMKQQHRQEQQKQQQKEQKAQPKEQPKEQQKQQPKPYQNQQPKPYQNQQQKPQQGEKKWFEKDKKEKNIFDNQPVSVKKDEFIKTTVPTLQGAKIVGKVDLNLTETSSSKKKKKRNRKRIGQNKIEIDNRQVDSKTKPDNKFEKTDRNNRPFKPRNVISGAAVNQSVKETFAKLTEGKKFNKSGVKYRQQKREIIRGNIQEQQYQERAEAKTLKITEFITANELATMMNASVNDVIKTYMNIGIFVGINQRLDAETINIVAEEFGFKTEFVSADAGNVIKEEEDSPEDLVPRPPVITVMGHVDHGKTSLLDYIRKTNVIAGEAGGITQHIGAYNVALENGRHITFLDTPGHSAFTAMRARGAKITDIAIIVVAADDDVMPQTIEAINHAAAANVPIVFAINKIDKDGADAEKIKGTLANMNYLVESWGGQYQSQDISAKKGINVQELLEKVLLEAEMLELKANPKRKASGSVIEFAKDKGRGNVATLLVQNGTLKVGDIVVAGYAYGKIRAMFNERNQKITEAKPAEPVMILGMKGEMQAGDNFNVMSTEHEARDIVNSRDQLKREMKLRTAQHLTLDEIGRRIALGSFQELNLIVKGDVDGSIEALSDSLIKLSTEEIKVNVIFKGVGQITESDINLAIASNAIVIGFNVRPAIAARRLAETEQIDIRLYSIIYQAIEEVKAAMEGMLLPEKSEKVTATLEVRETFKISKVGTIAGCMVKDGKIKRNSKVRLIRDGIVVFTGEIESLKHEKDDVKEVATGYECGLNIANFNDIKVGDLIESYEEIEIKKKL